MSSMSLTLRTKAVRAVTAVAIAMTTLSGATLAGVSAASPAKAASAPILFGLHNRLDSERLSTQRALGRSSALVGYFAGWERGLPSAAYLDRWTTQRGGVPVVHTGPAGYAPLARIINGTEDARIAAWADGTKAFGRPIMIRLMAEMNGAWEPWSTGVNGNRPGEYVLAWRHVVDMFRARGATNAVWVWNPNRDYPGATPMASLYPGSDYVDWIGLDIYNFGASAPSGWLPFKPMMQRSVRAIRAAAGPTKPLMINEVGCAEDSRKAAWIKGFYASLPRFGVKAVLWFDYDLKKDWRLTATSANKTAARFAVRRNGIRGAGQLPLSDIERIVTTGS